MLHFDNPPSIKLSEVVSFLFDTHPEHSPGINVSNHLQPERERHIGCRVQQRTPRLEVYRLQPATLAGTLKPPLR